ncbi:adenylate kinase [Paenibacillus larvae]|uniref:Adenylate kinase n=4 Tax=Paenibacillus larvae TaxID=1464 RepID=V9WCC4_9BACL|nr:adenylate kinase [Paenibacillus larvae]AHD07519.1 adenylate kinase Adk [Paenibacillus larvae subsp. larvae DSM 25430]AQR78498.1 adenylate kinase [Paenibacillus larvae subsp. larvae]AQT84775.1 adenylate kinase [Paenibacillus larvae subsp. pulvifaciens]AQZ46769.1 adenylate kinase [Paenibacillus larvae subsp. pulvifaciens]ARF68164.1 adenylate kinase [Paenibacillus larvae subsp. pulvifaciens]
MNIIFMGPPGAGKGTQAEKIVSDFQIPHISTGDAFRLAMSQGTPLGIKAKGYVDKGLLVPDEITNGIVKERLEQPDCAKGFLLDGYPRTIAQADALDEMLKSQSRQIDHVMNLTVDRELLLARLTGRRICKSCGATYHVLFNPPKHEGICDKCGGELYQRSDDTEEKVGTRLDEYTNKTAPLLDYYRQKGILREVNGEQDITAVTSEISSILRGQTE